MREQTSKVLELVAGRLIKTLQIRESCLDDTKKRPISGKR
jgi:hypothetical protein